MARKRRVKMTEMDIFKLAEDSALKKYDTWWGGRFWCVGRILSLLKEKGWVNPVFDRDQRLLYAENLLEIDITPDKFQRLVYSMPEKEWRKVIAMYVRD